MKRAKKATYMQKKLISKEGLEVRHWNVLSEDNQYLVIEHKETKEVKRLTK